MYFSKVESHGTPCHRHRSRPTTQGPARDVVYYRLVLYPGTAVLSHALGLHELAFALFYLIQVHVSSPSPLSGHSAHACGSSSSTSCGVPCRATRAGASTHLLIASEKKQPLLLCPPANVALTRTASGASDCKYDR